MNDKPRRVLIAGAGIAGMTAALAFAARGFSVDILEKAAQLEEVGAGLQLSPNATRLLDGLGVLQRLGERAVRPDALHLIDAGSLKRLASVRLGGWAEQRWGAPYLVAHRADLQRALLSQVSAQPAISLRLGAPVRNVDEISDAMPVGADGVWSSIRHRVAATSARPSGYVAWRATVAADSASGKALGAIIGDNAVAAFVHPAVHMVVYPIRGGSDFNLVAIGAGRHDAQSWSEDASADMPAAVFRSTSPTLRRTIADAGPWTVWPIHTASADGRWVSADGHAVLIGDAAHAMTPFAAQGAAMAIEDAVTLADAVAGASDSEMATTLDAWERGRRARISKVIRRGRLNRFAWHASGPIAMARNLFLRMRSPEQLAADLDWLYGWRPDGR